MNNKHNFWRVCECEELVRLYNLHGNSTENITLGFWEWSKKNGGKKRSIGAIDDKVRDIKNNIDIVAAAKLLWTPEKDDDLIKAVECGMTADEIRQLFKEIAPQNIYAKILISNTGLIRGDIQTAQYFPREAQSKKKNKCIDCEIKRRNVLLEDKCKKYCELHKMAQDASLEKDEIERFCIYKKVIESLLSMERKKLISDLR